MARDALRGGLWTLPCLPTQWRKTGGTAVLGLMQEWPLLCHKLIDAAARQHGAREIVSRSVEGPIVRTTYAGLRQRALKLAQRLDREGFVLGDRIATLAWNTARHLEAWYGIMGIGAIYHTLNPRLFPEQIAWIMNHAEDRALLVDLTFLRAGFLLLKQVADVPCQPAFAKTPWGSRTNFIGAPLSKSA